MTSLLIIIVPNLMGAISFAILIGLGQKLDLGTAMELIHLFNWIRSSFSKLITIRVEVLNAKVYLNRIQNYLCQEEINPVDIIETEKLKATPYAVRI